MLLIFQHQFTRDSRDSLILPSEGSLIKMEQVNNELMTTFKLKAKKGESLSNWGKSLTNHQQRKGNHQVIEENSLQIIS